MNTEARHPLLVVLVRGIRVRGTMWRPVMEIAGDYHLVAAPGPPGHGRRRGGAAPPAGGAVAGMDPPSPLLDHPGPVWLVNAARDPFRSDDGGFLRACRDGRLIVWPRRNHITCLAGATTLARIVLDAAATTPNSPLPVSGPHGRTQLTHKGAVS